MTTQPNNTNNTNSLTEQRTASTKIKDAYYENIRIHDPDP